MALVQGYGSDSDTDMDSSTVSVPAPSTFRPRPAAPQFTTTNDDDDDQDIDVSNDAFGISSLASKRSAASGSGSGSGSSGTKAETFQGAAPDVMASIDTTNSTSLITRPTDTILHVNPSYTDMTRPVLGPTNALSSNPSSLGISKMNTLTGYVEDQSMSSRDFTNQLRTFQVHGYAQNPSNLDGGNGAEMGFVGDVHQAWRNGGEMASERKMSRREVKEMKRKRKAKGNLGEFSDGEGEQVEVAVDPEGEGEGEEGEGQGERKKVKVQREYIGPWAGWEDEKIEVAGPSQEEIDEAERLSKRDEEKRLGSGKGPEVDKGKEIGFGQEKSVLHAKSLYDYQGRTYITPPRDVDVDLEPSEPNTQACFVPKKCVHTWTGHTKAVACVRTFPNSGHLLLSGSMDTRIKLWDVYHEGKCLRTFMGHSRAVKDVCFSNDGRKFLSAGMDRQMKLWDTETGQCLKAFSNGKIPYCIKFHPDEDKQHIFLAGMSDKKIIQYDTNSSEITQEYDQHLGPVNTITFVDQNRRFITSSDDKTLRAWDWDIPVVIKYIAEPSMHSMPAVAKHPNQKWLAMQSLDNQILIFGADDFRQNRKKRFAGHTAAGYACEPAFSPDGRWLSSGDGEGNLVFWDWKTCKIVKRIKAHKEVVISQCWLPHESSKVVTASWDGLIKLWD